MKYIRINLNFLSHRLIQHVITTASMIFFRTKAYGKSSGSFGRRVPKINFGEIQQQPSRTRALRFINSKAEALVSLRLKAKL